MVEKQSMSENASNKQQAMVLPCKFLAVEELSMAMLRSLKSAP